ncbi:hypothetical protein BI364_16145 [Acidihalobacter yilgarnensis]|uniref:DUF4124 domain-containing protein n=2 Tax=Acidihalobacter yilgarnensis TaxID=2819280 RepID=A0A1D8IRY7_9GAMM|nr:hypothetical protein BI364_16145 [Acidihalobacter yilgarnensis]
MLSPMARLLFIFCLLFTTAAQATIYRWVNAQGDVVFSDVPPPNGNAQKLELNHPLNTMQTPQQLSGPQPATGSSGQVAPYRSLAITSPTNNQSVRANNGDITVSLSLSPALRPGDRIRLFMDGAQVYSGTSTQIPLSNVNRGTHMLYAAVETAGGSVAIRSSGISFTLLRHSILFNPQQAAPGTGNTGNTPAPNGISGGVHQAPRAPMMPRAPQFHAPN